MKSTALSLMICMLLAALVGCSSATPTPSAPPTTLRYIGNSCTLITAPDGTCVVSDPYGDYSHAAGLSPLPDDLEADAVTISHFHEDHSNIQAVGGEPQVLYEPGAYEVGMIKVTGYESREGSPPGPSELVKNTVFVFEIDGTKIVHLGDAGEITEPDVLAAMEGADVVIVNIDGYVLPLDEVLPQLEQVNARTIIPSHYSIKENARWAAGAPTIDEFLEMLPSGTVVAREGSDIQVTPNMPKQVAVLEPLMLE
jgi:L-ascorbate metabolism protein UlaG (beta-lactamase superfamily)